MDHIKDTDHYTLRRAVGHTKFSDELLKVEAFRETAINETMSGLCFVALQSRKEGGEIKNRVGAEGTKRK